MPRSTSEVTGRAGYAASPGDTARTFQLDLPKAGAIRANVDGHVTVGRLHNERSPKEAGESARPHIQPLEPLTGAPSETAAPFGGKFLLARCSRNPHH